MIFITVNQLYIFCIIVLGGMLACCINEILGVIFISKYHNKIISTFFKLIKLIITSCILIFFVGYFNYGSFSPFIIIGFLLGFIWIKLSLVKLLDFLQIKFYYMYIYILNCVKFYFARKNESIKD